MKVQERSPLRDELLKAVETSADQLRQGADASEDARCLVPESLEVLRTSRLLEALSPQEVGGLQVDPITEMELIEAISAIDGSTGWTYWALAGSTARAASMLPDTAVSDVFPVGGQAPLIAFQESAFGNTAHPTRGGLVIDGRWPYCTGAAYADWVVAIGRADSPLYCPWPDSPELAAVVPIGEVTVVDDWDAPGLAGTGTVGYRISRTVPWSHVWPYPVREPARGGVHFVCRRAAIKHLGFALGVARGALEEFTAHASTHSRVRRAADLTTDLARCRLSLDATRALGVSAVSDLWREAREHGTVEAVSYRRVRAVARHATEVAVQVCGLVVRHGTASMLARQNRLHRALRDITAASAHAEAGPVSLDEFAADLLEGLDQGDAVTSAIVTALRADNPPIVRAEGGYFVLADGRRMLDMASQTLNLAFGQQFPAVQAAVVDQVGRVEFASSKFATEPFIRLSQRLVELAPAGLGAVAAKLTNGSDAVETAVKVARLHTRRREVGVLPGAWHGESYLTLGLASTHRGRLIADPALAVVAEEPTFTSLSGLVESRRDLAAVVVDPVMVSHGLAEIPDWDGLRALRKACDAAGTLLVTDEVQSFGWLGGPLFSTEITGVCPDVVCLGKALGAGYPLAAVLMRTDLGSVLQYNDAEFTGGGHPVSCAASLAGLETLTTMRARLRQRAEEFDRMLAAIAGDALEVRRAGLIATMTSTRPRLRETWTARVVAECAMAGVFVRATDKGRRLLVKPPLVVEPSDMAAGLATVAKAAEVAETQTHRARTLATVAAGPPPRHGWAVARKTMRPNPNAGYVAALLRTAGDGLHLLTRTPVEQQRLTSRLADLGISAAPVYATGVDAIEYGWIPGRTLSDVLAAGDADPAAVNGAALRHYELVARAIDHGIVIGDRWPGNAVVTARSEVVLLDFEFGYAGPHHEATLIEELFCVVQTLAAIPEGCRVRASLASRLVDAVAERHGAARTADMLGRLVRFYLDPGRPAHSSSDAADAYAGILWSALSRVR